jgi:hypothetical protein
MSLPWWKPDEELLAESLGQVQDLACEVRRAISGSPRRGSRDSGDEGEEGALSRMADLLQAAGAAAFMGEDAAVRRLGDLAETQGAEDLAARTLGVLIEQGLAPRLSGLLRDICDYGCVAEEDRPCLEERIVEALAERDRVELAIEGARCLCAREPRLDDETLAALLSFDEVLRAELWRTLPLGTRRAARCAWAAPGHRGRLWWWNRGCDLPHTALEDMQTAARVIHLFPEAREELERLLQAERDLDEMCAAGASPEPRKVIPLRDYLLNKLRPEVPDEDRKREPFLCIAEMDARYLAASPYGEKPLLRTAEFTLSTDGESLILDIESPAESAPGRLPQLEAAGHPPLAASRAAEPARYEFSLSAPHFSVLEAWLVVSLKDGERRLRLPFDESP